MVVWMQIFFGDYLVVWQQCFDVVGFDDGIIVFYVFDGVGDQFFFVFQEVVQYLFVFGVVDFLQDYLFGSLCVDMVEVDWFKVFFNVIVDLYVGQLFVCIDDVNLVFVVFDFGIGQYVLVVICIVVVGFMVDFNVDIGVIIDMFFGC